MPLHRRVARRSIDVSVTCMQLDALNLTLTAVFEPAPEGGFTCRFEELPDVFSQGETLEEARANLADALNLVLEYHRDEARGRAVDGAVREPLHLVAS
jgi:predicted RNase H-like HicB family nuclease